jgi:hypothetical protein
MFDNETLLRNCTSVTPGVFILQKAKFLNVQNVHNPRCDNLTYSGVNVADGTEYINEALVIDVSSAFSGTKVESRQVTRYERVIDASPQFIIIYVEFRPLKKTVTHIDIQRESTPAVMWYGRSFFHLLKNIREWSIVNSEGIDANHPMGIYSSIALSEFAPSEEILNEIDGWPDMHLAKFLKGNQNYKAIPEDFPEPTEEMKQWVLSLAHKYQEKTFSEILDII